ncbi:hypothetical protein FACS1894162_6790 [Bacteroidia bacterium]|nr:hypothetical protein FACS1894162_6790 [Bacteroidia bacterium]
MKTFSITSALKKLQAVAVRFPISLLLLIGTATLCCIAINELLSNAYEIPFQLWIFFSLGTILSVAATLSVENLKCQQWKQYGITFLCVLLWGVYCLFLPDEKHIHFDTGLQVFIFGATFTVAAFFISFLKKNQDAEFWGFSKKVIVQLFLAAVFGGVIDAGLSVALLSIDSLFGVDISYKYYANLAVFCFILFTPIYFLATIPSKTEKYVTDLSFHKAFKILGLYILLPILGLYFLILYTYLIKIIAIWELPNGWVSTLVSILAIGGLLVTMILYPVWLKKENKVVTFFTRYFGILILPLLVLMSVGIFRRINDYGISINRLYILLLNAWFYGIFIYLFLTKNKHIKWIIITPTIILLLASVGPWRISNVTKHVISNKLESTLNELDFLQDGKISLTDSKVYFAKMDSTAKASVREPLDYLADTYGMESVQPFFIDNIQHQSMYYIIQTLDLEWMQIKIVSEDYFLFEVEGIQLSDIKGYHSFIFIENKSQCDSLSIPIQNNILKLAKTVTEDQRYHQQIPFSPQNKNIVICGSDYSLYIKKVIGDYYPQKDSISIDTFEGFLFYK